MKKQTDPTKLGTKTATDTAAGDAEAMEAIVVLAASITNDKQFILVLQDTDPKLRREVYELIKPHVNYPDPRRFDLMSFECDA
jgi:hypothetical protein